MEEGQWYSALPCLHPGLCVVLQLKKAVSGLANSDVSLMLRTQHETARLPSALGVKLMLCLGFSVSLRCAVPIISDFKRATKSNCNCLSANLMFALFTRR